MSLTTLINNAIPFQKNGPSITIDSAHMGKLLSLYIPFTFKDKKILLTEQKPTDYLDNLISNIKKTLQDSQRFLIKSYSGHKILVEYDSKHCLIDIIDNELVMVYAGWTNKIIINSKNIDVNDGFVLLIIAGFKYRIASASWDCFWVLNSKLRTYDCKYYVTDKTYSNTLNFKFYNDGIPYIMKSLDDAIKHLDTFKM